MHNLRILVFSNPLVVDKIGKTFLYQKDSGFIFTKNLIASMPGDYRYYWVIPAGLVAADGGWFRDANRHVELVPYPYSTSIHQNRYEFYGDVFRRHFHYGMDVDVILNNQPEVSANFRVWAENQRRESPVILSFFHWIDCAESRRYAPGLGGYIWRQIEGARVSDLNFFHGTYAESLFVREVCELLGDDNPLGYRIPTGYFYPPATKFGHTPFDLGVNEKKIVLFNHRLNNSTGWGEVLDVFSKIAQLRNDFVLWFTDDSDPGKKYLENLPYVVRRRVPFENYGYLIANAHFGVCNTSGYATWNMAVLDTIENGAVPLVPDIPLYRSMLPAGDHFHSGGESLYAKCLDYLDMPKARVLSVLPAMRASSYVQNDNASTVLTAIDRFISRHVGRSTPKGYDLVARFIRANGVVKKADWVNHFWSFHVNSNFQHIRWKLLGDGFYDDVSSSETVYTTEDRVAQAVGNQIALF